MRIDTENTGAYLVLKPRHDSNNNNQGHNTDGNTDNRDPCRERYESLFSFGTEIPETDICFVVHAMFILVFVFCESFYIDPDYINTNQQSTGNFIFNNTPMSYHKCPDHARKGRIALCRQCTRHRSVRNCLLHPRLFKSILSRDTRSAPVDRVSHR